MELKKSLFVFGLFSACMLFFTQCEKEPTIEDDTYLQGNDVEESNLILKNGEVSSETLRHFILVEFIDNMSGEQKKGFTEALVGLKDSIDEVVDIEWGKDLRFNEELDQDFENCYMVTLNSLEDFFTYLYHPSLEYFHSIWLPFVKNVMVFDYWADDVETSSCSNKRYSELRNLTLFKYREDITDEEKSAVVDGFSALPERIKGIQKMEKGSELLLLGLNQGYTDGFFLTFSKLGDYVSYLHQSAYRKFMNNVVDPNVEDVLILEYVTQPQIPPHGGGHHHRHKPNSSHGKYQSSKKKALF